MWFADLIQSLRREKKTAKGHVGSLDEVMIELTYLHQTLLNVLKDEEYRSAVEKAKPHIAAMAERGAEQRTELDAMLVALYGWLVLRMGGKSVSPETEESLAVIRDWANLLGGRYIRMRAGAL